MNNLMAFGFYGGKSRLFNDILDAIPYEDVTTYIEPFGGSAAVLINKLPHAAEIYCDVSI